MHTRPPRAICSIHAAQLLLTGLLFSSAAIAQQTTPDRTHPITLDDYFTLATINDCVASPDGKLVAYTESRWQTPDEGRNIDLWVTEVETGKATRLTFDACPDTSPRWSWDSKYIYFLSSPKKITEREPPYDGQTQVWRVRINGEDLQAVTRIKGGVEAFDLSRDTGTLYYSVNVDHTDDEWKSLKNKFKSLSYGHGVDQHSEVWKLELQTWRSEKLCEPKRFVKDFTVSPDGRRIALHTTPTSQLISNEGWSQVEVFDTRTEKMTTLPDDLYRKNVASPYAWVEGLAWSADGGKLAFTASWDGYPTELLVAEWVNDQPALRKLDRPAGVYVAGGLRWRGEQNQLCFLGGEKARVRIFVIDGVTGGKQGNCGPLTPGDVVVLSYSFSEKGGLPVVLAADPGSTPELYRMVVGAHKADFAKITNSNPQVLTWKLPKISIVSWKSRDGAECEGILELPPDAEPGKKLPLVVEIHGGPTDATPYCLQFTIYGRTLMASKGYALFSPNYRGSTGYGDKFLTDLVGHENEIDVADILTGVDALVEKGVADPERLAVMGWSNGGFLTNCIITSDTRFKAASSGAGVVDQFIQFAAEDTPGHVLNYMQGFFWDKPDAYHKGSPSARLNQIKTPTLIHVGANDARVPAVHARTLHRVLHQYLHVPCELVVYPGEGHGLTKYRHRQAKMEWDLAWYEKYLSPSTKTPKAESAAAATEGAIDKEKN